LQNTKNGEGAERIGEETAGKREREQEKERQRERERERACDVIWFGVT